LSRQQIDFPVQQHHIATPPPPPAGSLKLYPKSDNVLYKLTSAGVESAVGVIPDPLVVNNATVNQVLTVGQRIKGDFSNATKANRTLFQASATDSLTEVGVIPSGTGTSAWLEWFNKADPDNSTALWIGVDSTRALIQTAKLGTGADLPLVFNAYGQERGRMDSISTNWNTPQDLRINSNVYYDGAAWTRFDTVNPLSHINVGRGTFNYYNAVAGAGAPAWVPRLTIATDGVVTIGNSNARIWDYGSADPNATSERLMGINALTVTPGTLHTARIQCNGPLGVTGGISTNAITTADWFRITGSGQGIYNQTHNRGVGIDASGPYNYHTGHQLVDVASAQTLSSKTLSSAAGSLSSVTHYGHLTMSGGYVFGSYINMTADINGSAPAYVAGQNGDGYLRWYTKSSVIPALNWAQLTTSAAAAGGGAWTNCTFSGSGNGYCRNDSSQMTVLKAGVFSLFAAGGGYYSVGVRIVVDGVVQASQTNNINEFAAVGCGWTGYVGSWVQVHRYGGVAQGAQPFHMTWVPTSTYGS
jgi:hypothetical protein